MRKIMTILSLSLASFAVAQSTTVGKFNVLMTNSDSQELIKQEKNVSVKFYPSEYFWKIEIDNKSPETIEIDWDKATFSYQKKVSKIVFDDTRKLFANQPKGKESIPAGLKLIKRIYPLEYIDVMSPTLSRSDLKRWGKATYDINLHFDSKNDSFDINGAFEASLIKK